MGVWRWRSVLINAISPKFPMSVTAYVDRKNRKRGTCRSGRVVSPRRMNSCMSVWLTGVILQKTFSLWGKDKATENSRVRRGAGDTRFAPLAASVLWFWAAQQDPQLALCCQEEAECFPTRASHCASSCSWGSQTSSKPFEKQTLSLKLNSGNANLGRVQHFLSNMASLFVYSWWHLTQVESRDCEHYSAITYFGFGLNWDT